MLTRIISAAVLILVSAAVVFVSLWYSLPIALVIFLSILNAFACYELLKNTGISKSRVTVVSAVVYGASALFIYTYLPRFSLYAALIFGLVAVIAEKAKEQSYKALVFSAVMPVLISYCFNCLVTLLGFGLPHILLLLNFSSICDSGAYFVGVTIGKHKLCPKISPKKTVEGAVGGIVFSLIGTAVIVRAFSLPSLGLMLLITPVLCVASMCGDLGASLIKRRVGIKDYGKIIPGHGGIMDRFDSILLIAPIYVILYSLIG